MISYGYGVVFRNEVETWLTRWMAHTKREMIADIENNFGTMEKACIECNAIQGHVVRVKMSVIGKIPKSGDPK